MPKAYLAISNLMMKTYLKELNKFEISEDPTSDDNDFLFCDNLYLGEKIKAKTKIYLLCNRFEYLYDLTKYQDYSYFVTFGEKVTNIITSIYDINPSKTFDGFVYSQKFEDKFPNKEYDIFIYSTAAITNIFEATVLMAFIDFLTLFEKSSSFKIGSNVNSDFFLKNDAKLYYPFLEKRDPRILEMINNQIDFNPSLEVPLKYLNNSKIVFNLCSNLAINFSDSDFYNNKLFLCGEPNSLAYDIKCIDENKKNINVSAIKRSKEFVGDTKEMMKFLTPGKRAVYIEQLTKNHDQLIDFKDAHEISKNLIDELDDDKSLWVKNSIKDDYMKMQDFSVISQFSKKFSNIFKLSENVKIKNINNEFEKSLDKIINIS